jgi:hypothetical protein
MARESSPLGRVIGIGVALLVLLILCLFAGWRVVLSRDVNKQFSRIRAAGYPVSGAELNTWRPAVPDAENGALVMTQAFALLRTFPDARSNDVGQIIVGRTNAWSAATNELVDEYLQTNNAALPKVREAIQFSRFRYPVDYSYGTETDMSHLSKLKEVARLAALGASLDGGAGRADQWPEKVKLLLKLAGTLDDEPDLISHLSRNSITSLAVKVIERNLNLVNPSDEACRRLQADLSRVGATNWLPLALVGERALHIATFRLSFKDIQSYGQNGGEGSPPREPQRNPGKPMTLLWLTGFFERDLDFYLGAMDMSISLAALPAPGSLAMSNYVVSAGDVARKRLYVFSDILLPTLSRLASREAVTQASIRLAATALAVERFRIAQGRLPGGLKELTPQFLDVVPTDPFDGTPLRYHPLAHGYIVYSVGADGRDDGGREPPAYKKSGDTNSYDLTFIVEH